MKGIYLNFVQEYEIGVIKKLNFQIKSFNKLGVNIKKCKIIEDKFYIDDFFINNYHIGTSFKEKLLRKIDLYFSLKKLQRTKLYEDINFMYIRYFYSSPWFISYLKFLKKLNLKIILEIPTYPYDGEVKDNFFTRWDKKYREELHKYVDKIVTYSNDKEIWEIPCINISNGIDLEEIQMIDREKIESKIIFTSVSNCSIWHGIDRLIYSILEYIKNNGKEKIIFNIVGEGNEISKLKQIVNENKELENIVIFHGRKSGKELDKIYNITNIGVGSLGIHRINLETVQPLKNREYCAKGLPFIISFNDPYFKDKEFVYKVSNNEKLLDIEKIIEWYKNLKITSKEIREYSKNFSWDIQMKKVVDYLKEGK
ncbi:glycosyltransferase family 1 protein [Fusobacterium varium]|mgnify:CR=1 FL=1|uniref:glycosyltransferase n=1 Tax=Fusobacterium varium TaxID=856 RepID=UPI000E546CB6|nr:glycosyltransferase [Fusobacterium varium]RHG36104.1 glycosyltransferase family 1 protein [Fusobacterium varium]